MTWAEAFFRPEYVAANSFSMSWTAVGNSSQTSCVPLTHTSERLAGELHDLG